MTDETPALTDEEARRIGRENLRQMLATPHEESSKVQCVHCARWTPAKIADPDKMVRILKYLDERDKDGKDDGGRKAQVTLDRIREMSTAELAELAVELGIDPYDL